jgi:GNAT superfamily N-acetyltransferase
MRNRSAAEATEPQAKNADSGMRNELHRDADAPVALRSAAVADAAAMAALMTELGYPTSAGQMEARLQHLLGHPDYHTIVAEADGRVVGLVGLGQGWYYEKDGSYARVLALIVEAARRGTGVGGALLRAGEAWAAQRGVGAVVLNSGEHRRDAHRFYQRMGYEGTGVRFVKVLG